MLGSSSSSKSTGKPVNLVLELPHLLPGVLLVGEVAVRGSLEVDGSSKVEILHKHTGSEVKVLLDDLNELGRRVLGGSVGVNEDGQRLGNTNGVGELNQGSSGKSGLDQRLGDPSGSVGGRSVDLGVVLSGESSSSVGTPSSVGVDNDLSASETGITLGTSDDESARGLDVVDGLVVEQLGGDDLLDDLLENLGSQVLGGDLLRVLGGDDNGVDSLGDGSTVLVDVLNGDLGLGVGSQPSERTVSSSGSQSGVELVGQNDGQGEQLLGLIGGIAKHDTLITSSELLKSLLVVETLGDIGRLLLNGDQHVAGLVVKALLGVVVANVLDGVSHNLLVVQSGLGSDLTEDHDHTGLGGGLAGNLGEGVLLEAGVQNGVRDLVTDLIGVSLTDGSELVCVQLQFRIMWHNIGHVVSWVSTVDNIPLSWNIYNTHSEVKRKVSLAAAVIVSFEVEVC